MLQSKPARSAGAAKLVIVKSDASPYANRAQSDPMISTTQGIDQSKSATL